MYIYVYMSIHVYRYTHIIFTFLRLICSFDDSGPLQLSDSPLNWIVDGQLAWTVEWTCQYLATHMNPVHRSLEQDYVILLTASTLDG